MVADSDREAVAEILRQVRDQKLSNGLGATTSQVQAEAVDRICALIDRAVAKARIEESHFMDGYFDNDEVDRDELLQHYKIRQRNLLTTPQAPATTNDKEG